MVLQPVYTVPDCHGLDLKLDSLKISVAFKTMIISLNLKATNHRESDVDKYYSNLTELEVVTNWVRYCENENQISIAMRRIGSELIHSNARFIKHRTLYTCITHSTENPVLEEI